MRRGFRLSAFGLLLAGLASCSFFDYSGMVGNKYALVYGVTRYSMTPPPGTGPNLSYPDADATSMVAVLSAQGYTVTSRWVDVNGNAFTDDPTNGVVNHGAVGSPATVDGVNNTGATGPGELFAPSKINILNDIQALSSTIGQNDTLVIYFSGHGTQDPSLTPSREYFDPYGAVMEYPVGSGSYYDFAAPSIRDDELRSAFDAIRTPRKVLILDTCNSGGFIGNTLESDWTPPAIAGSAVFVGPGTLAAAISAYASMTASTTGLSPYGAQVLSAAGRDELSYETSAYGHGVMTYWLLQGLAGPADLNHDGHITVLESFAYAKAGVDQNWNPAVGSASSFEPHVSGGPVDFVLF